MDDSLYDTSYTLHTLSTSRPALAALLVPPPANDDADKATLTEWASRFRETVGQNRPRYEDEEEKEKIGTLRDCSWTRLAPDIDNDNHDDVSHDARRERHTATNGARSRSRSRGSSALLISLYYEKTIHKFILYTAAAVPGPGQSSARQRAAPSPPLPPPTLLLLSKSSLSTLKSLLAFLSSRFATSCAAFKPSPALLQRTLESYLVLLSRSLAPIAHTHALAPLYKSLLGTLRLTIALAGPVAPALRTIDIDVLAETLATILQSSGVEGGGGFLVELARHVHARTGLKLPVAGAFARAQSQADGDSMLDGDAPAAAEEPLRISRLTTAAYAISIDGKLKFASKAVEAWEGLLDASTAGAIRGRRPDGERENMVRRANEILLLAVLREAERQQQEQEGDEVA